LGKNKTNQDQLTKTEKNQTELNIKFQTLLNELATAMNQISKTETHLLEIILAKNRIVITDLENILMGLSIAKLNIVSPLFREI